MISANELRIGNLVHDNFDISKPNKLTKISIDDFIAIGNNCNNYHPIPLTEEWMVKFGFYRLKYESYTFGNGKIGVYFDGKQLLYDIAKIKYVHQLQNLYFALCGQELVLNETV